MWKATKRKPAELEQPEFPSEFAHLLGWLAALPSPITWSELKAWSDMTGARPARWELETLMRLDRQRQT